MRQNRRRWWRWTKRKKRTHMFWLLKFTFLNCCDRNFRGIDHACTSHAQAHTHSSWKWNTWSTCYASNLVVFFSEGVWPSRQMFMCVNRCYQTPIVSPNNHHFYPIERIRTKKILTSFHFIGCFSSFSLVWVSVCVLMAIWFWMSTSCATNRRMNDTHIAHYAHAVHRIILLPLICMLNRQKKKIT